MSDYELIDNFLPLEVFNELHTMLLHPDKYEIGADIPFWQYSPLVISWDPSAKKEKKEDWRLFFLVHNVYDCTILSPFHEKIIPYFTKALNLKALRRVKINMYPNTETLKEHGIHIDYSFPHKAGILSINTCDGYTKLEDGTKIDSVANRMLLFDASNPHNSSTTTNQPVRVNININYF